MRSDNTVIYIIAGVILLHFVVGIGYLIYKLLLEQIYTSTFFHYFLTLNGAELQKNAPILI